jgi:hypothetical protein
MAQTPETQLGDRSTEKGRRGRSRFTFAHKFFDLGSGVSIGEKDAVARDATGVSSTSVVSRKYIVIVLRTTLLDLRALLHGAS